VLLTTAPFTTEEFLLASWSICPGIGEETPIGMCIDKRIASEDRWHERWRRILMVRCLETRNLM